MNKNAFNTTGLLARVFEKMQDTTKYCHAWAVLVGLDRADEIPEVVEDVKNNLLGLLARFGIGENDHIPREFFEASTDIVDRLLVGIPVSALRSNQSFSLMHAYPVVEAGFVVSVAADDAPGYEVVDDIYMVQEGD